LQDGSVDAWVQSVCSAADELKQRAGVSSLCFIGIRSGVAIASLAAQGRDDILGLIAVAPVIKGRGFVRELTALHAATNKRSDDKAPQGVFQSGGYVMSLPTRDALSAIDLTQLPAAPAPHVLILDRDDMPASSAWSDALQAAGANVAQQSLPGYVGMMADPHHAVAPQAMIDASLNWLAGTVRPLAAQGGPAAKAAHVVLPQEDHRARVPVSGLAGAMVHEQAMVLPGVPAFGILTTHVSDTVRSGHAILLLNAGSTRRIGSSRMSVEQARKWAAQGHVVLRLDLAGVGDSEVRPGRPLNMSYPNEAMLDVRAAVEFLRHMQGVSHVHACGLCSGAYHALKAARDGMPLASITLINPLVYFNAEGLTLDDELDLSPRKVHSAAASYKAAATSMDKWIKLFKGQVHVSVLLKVFAKRMGMAAGVRFRELARAVHWPLTDDLGTELRHLTARGVHVQFVFSQGDPGEIMLREMAGGVLGTLQRKGQVGVRVIAGADHVFTDLGLRRDMLAYLDQVMAELTMVNPTQAVVHARPLTAQSS